MTAKRVMLFALLLVSVLVISGCVSYSEFVEMAKNDPSIKEFLQDHPNTQVSVEHYTANQTERIIGNIRNDCKNSSIEVSEYYKVIITDTDGLLKSVAWIKPGNKYPICAYREVGQGSFNELFGKKFSVIGDGYDAAFSPFVLNGNLAYVASEITQVEVSGGYTENRKNFIVYDDQEIGKQYDTVLSYLTNQNNIIATIDGKLAYFATKGNNIYLVYGNEEGVIGTKANRTNPIEIKEINGKLVYVYSDLKSHIVYDGQEVGSEYASVNSPVEINGKLAYVATEDNRTFIVYDGQEIGKQYGKAHTPVNVNGKLAYIAEEDCEVKEMRGYSTLSCNKSFIVFNGQELGKEYDYVASPMEVNGKLLYKAKLGDKIFFVYNGQEVGKEYEFVDYAMDINGKLAYVAGRMTPALVGNARTQEMFVIYDGKVLGNYYFEVDGMVSVNGKIAFLASKASEHILYYNGKEVVMNDDCKDLTNINGKLAFVLESGKSYILMEN